MDGFHHLLVVLTLVSYQEISSSAETFARFLSVGWPGREQPMRRLTSTSGEPITASKSRSYPGRQTTQRAVVPVAENDGPAYVFQASTQSARALSWHSLQPLDR